MSDDQSNTCMPSDKYKEILEAIQYAIVDIERRLDDIEERLISIEPTQW